MATGWSGRCGCGEGRPKREEEAAGSMASSLSSLSVSSSFTAAVRGGRAVAAAKCVAFACLEWRPPLTANVGPALPRSFRMADAADADTLLLLLLVCLLFFLARAASSSASLEGDDADELEEEGEDDDAEEEGEEEAACCSTRPLERGASVSPLRNLSASFHLRLSSARSLRSPLASPALCVCSLFRFRAPPPSG